MKLKTLLGEMPRIESGEKDFTDPRLGYIIPDNELTLFKHLKTLKPGLWLTQSPYENTYMLIDSDKSTIIGIMELLPIKIPGYDNTFQVNQIVLMKEYRGLGLAEIFYSSVVKMTNKKLVTDEVVYTGAKKLWSRMIKSNKFKIDYVNMQTKENIKNISNVDDYFGIGIAYKYKLLILMEDYGHMNKTIYD